MSRSDQSSSSDISPTEEKVKSSMNSREIFLRDFDIEKKREELFRKYPDWTLLERINLNHPEMFTEFSLSKKNIDESLTSQNLSGSKNYLIEYRKKLDKYMEIFESERISLDKVKKVQQEAVRFNAILKSESKSMPAMIAAAEVDTDKKLLRKMHKEIKNYAREMKLLTSQLYKNMTILPKNAFAILGEINHIETNYSRLHEAIISRNANYFPKSAAKKTSKSTTGTRKIPEEIIEESLIVMNFMEEMRANLSTIKKNMQKYERAFKTKKGEISGKVIWRLQNTHKPEDSQALPTNARDEVMARMAHNADARQLVDGILTLQTELESLRAKTNHLIKKGNQKNLTKILSEVDSKRDKHWAKIADVPEMSLDPKKAAEFVDTESIAEVLRDKNSLASRIQRGGFTLELKAIIKNLKVLISKYLKLYLQEDKIASSIRTERKLLERRLVKLKEMDDNNLKNYQINQILEDISEKMQALQNPVLQKSKASNIIIEIEKLIKNLIIQKKTLEHASHKIK